MPVKEFKGTLDEPKVREFTGELDSSGPPDLSRITASMGPSDMSAVEMRDSSNQLLQQEADKINREIPMIERESFHQKSLPIVGGLASLIVPGSGWGALALQSLFAGAGTAATEGARQNMSGEKIDPAAIFKTGATNAAVSYGAGAVLKGLGSLAKKVFSSPLNDPQSAAAAFAKESDVPFPLSSAAAGSGAARSQNMAGGSLPGAIRNQMDANKVAVFLNNRVGTMTEKANVFDDAAKQGQAFLRQVFEPGETAYKAAFGEFTETAGEQAAIPIDGVKQAAKAAADRLQARGQTTGGLYQRLRTILKTDAATMTPGELDELYGAVIKQSFNSRAAAGGEGKILLAGIVSDMDAFVPGTAQKVAEASATREAFRELRKIPALEKLAAEMKAQGGAKGSIDWMDTLFASGNGKALTKFKELNPELYGNLADAYLARQIDTASGFSKGGFARQVDGQKLRQWFTSNQGRIKEIYGPEQAKVLDNFTNYAAHMTGAQAAVAKEGVGMNLPTFGRLAAEGAATLKAPLIMLPTQAAAFVLAKGLSDPSSQLFRLFTTSRAPTTKFLGLQAGQEVAREYVREKSREDAR